MSEEKPTCHEDSPSCPLRYFLRDLDLEEKYANLFEELGYRSVEQLYSCSEEELRALLERVGRREAYGNAKRIRGALQEFSSLSADVERPNLSGEDVSSHPGHGFELFSAF